MPLTAPELCSPAANLQRLPTFSQQRITTKSEHASQSGDMCCDPPAIANQSAGTKPAPLAYHPASNQRCVLEIHTAFRVLTVTLDLMHRQASVGAMDDKSTDPNQLRQLQINEI
jgi:hypothetical protein